MLETELAYYKAHKDEWLKSHRERFVLVKGEELVGTFDTYEQAIREGARRFGLANFLVRRVTEPEEPLSVPALTLGLLGATPYRQV
jgi:hypothetical protein